MATKVSFLAVISLVLVSVSSFSRADIYRWDNGELIPGTKGITPAPGVDLSNWSSSSRNLRYADFSGDLSGSNFTSSWLDNARFINTNLSSAQLYRSELTDANLSGAVVTGTQFAGTTSRGFTSAQLYSTTSYQDKNLQGIGLAGNDLTNWDFSGQNLNSATLNGATLTGANLSGAVVTWTGLTEITLRGFTQPQLASTASYQAKDLQGISLVQDDLTGWDFSGQNLTMANFWKSTLTEANLSGANLTGAYLAQSTLTNANLSGAVVAGASFSATTSHGFTAAKLYSTQSYQAKDLSGIRLASNDLTGWDFRLQDLANAIVENSTLTDADLRGANLKNAKFGTATGLTSAKFSSETIYNQWTQFPAGFSPSAMGLTYSPSSLGDLDANGELSIADVELLQQTILSPFSAPWSPIPPSIMFDLNNDSLFSTEDVTVWVKDLKHTYFGDANMDGEFNSGDLVQVFSGGKFEATMLNANYRLINPATWSSGDWDTDGVFTTSDLVVAFEDGGYEAGPRPVVAAVPEPSGLQLLATGLCGFLWRRSVRQK